MRNFLFIFLSLIASVNYSAQCTHTLILTDSYGDGWVWLGDVGSVDLTVDGVTVITQGTCTGFSTSISFQANTGSVISLSNWISDGFDSEFGFEILDGNGDEIASGSYLDLGTSTGNCPNSCNEITSINTTNLTSSSLDIDWPANSSANSWNFEYDISGFSQGTGSTDNTTTNSLSLSGLNASTSYDIYLQTVCDGETSDWAGPFSFYISSVPCGSYTLSLIDSYGDGWNGNTIDLLINGNIVLDDVTIVDGDLNNITFQVGDGDAITTIWNGGGSFAYETSYELLDFEGNVVGSGSETDISDAIIVICPCNPEENPTFTVSQECNEDDTYNVIINISNVGDGSSTLDILNNESIEFSGVGIGSHTITNLSGSNIIKLTNDNICSVSQILNDVCGPCYDPSAPSDLPCDAPALDLSQPFFGTTDCDLYGVSNTGLMPGPDNLETSCFGNGALFGSQNDSWLSFTAADDSVILDWEVTDCDDGNGVQLAILDGICSNEDEMTVIDCEFQALGTGTFDVGNLIIGDSYFIYIDGYSGDQCDYSWTPQGGVAITPPNDSCGNAIEISCGSLDTSNNILATDNDAPSVCSGLTPDAGVWYKYNGNGNEVTISTDNVATNFDTQLFLYSGDFTSKGLSSKKTLKNNRFF